MSEVHSKTQPRPQGVAEWCDHHDLIGALLPFEYRATDAFEAFRTLSESIDGLPHTAATFTLGELADGNEAGAWGKPTGSNVVSTQLHLLGAWEYRSTSTGKRWSNPHYVHGHPWQSPQGDTQTRIEIIRDAAQLGALRVADIAPRFGITPSALDSFIVRHNLPFGEWRRDGRQRLARTLRTVQAWSGRELWAMCQLFRVPAETVETWVHRDAGSEWSPPGDPSNRRGFQTGQQG